jgi:hypothetical protein
MFFQSLRSFLLVGLCLFACLVFSACNKTYFVKRTSSDPLKQTRLDWNYKTTVDAYQKAGFTSRKWNASAERALAEFACSRADVLETNEPWGEIISTNAAAAIRSGCKDPMIGYLNIRFYMSQTNSPNAFASAFRNTADEMQQSSYPKIRKFYASLRAAEQLKFAAGDISNTPPEVHEYRRLAMTNLANALEDKFMPVGEVDDACNEMLDALEKNSKQSSDFYQLIEQPIFDNWPNESVSWLLKGRGYTQMAWSARGNSYAKTVTDDGWKLFNERLAIAEESLDHAWKLNPNDPRIAVKMIGVELGQGKGRDRMELWFNRAMELNTNYYDACYEKLYYLEPKWHGSIEEMLKFGHECVTNQSWGGRIPLILMDAHNSIQRQYIDASEKDDYWKRPDVWSDIKSAFDRFFELNPDETSWYHNYARYAYRAEQWEQLNELIPKLGSVNYAFFGGEDEFNIMVQLAKEHASEPK